MKKILSLILLLFAFSLAVSAQLSNDVKIKKGIAVPGSCNPTAPAQLLFYKVSLIDPGLHYCAADGTYDPVAGGGAGAESPLTLTANNASEVPLTLKGAAAHSGNLLEVQNSAGTVLSRIYSNGYVSATKAYTFLDNSDMLIGNLNENGYLYLKTQNTTGTRIVDNTDTVTFEVRGTSNGGTTSFFKGGNVASAAAITPTGNVFHVTGTTTITSITATNVTAGTCLTIIFDGALTFTDGSNLKLAGNFVTTADDTISLCYDGTSFFETARSQN